MASQCLVCCPFETHSTVILLASKMNSGLSGELVSAIQPFWSTCRRRSGCLKWKWSWNHGAVLCHGMIIPFFSLKVLNWGRRSHNLYGEMVWWISLFFCFSVMSSFLFLAAQPTVASIKMSLLSGTFLELWLCPSLMNLQSHLSDLVFEMLLCADSSEDTIPEELSKHLVCVCMGTSICLLRI